MTFVSSWAVYEQPPKNLRFDVDFIHLNNATALSQNLASTFLLDLTLHGAGPDFMLGCTQVLLQQYLGLWSGSNFMQQQSAEIQPLPTVWAFLDPS